MNLLVVTAFTEKDHHLAVKMYQWIEKLGGIKNNDVVLVIDRELSTLVRNRVLIVAKRCAKSVQCISAKFKHDSKWPSGANAAFMAAVEFSRSIKRQFLWLEPDCVPTTNNWLRSIEEEYSRCGKACLGDIVDCKPPLPEKVLAGVSVYDPMVIDMAHIKPNVAFDVALSRHLVPLSHKSKLFQFFSGANNTRPDVTKLDQLRPGVVLFHSDKNHNLIRLLQEAETNKQRVPVKQQPVVAINKNTKSDITVVITTHNRLEKCKRALDSCKKAGVKHIVITATGYHRRHNNELKALKSDGVDVIINTASASNPAWIEGITKATTKWVHILHDDDMILPSFLEIEKHLDTFAMFPAAFHREKDQPEYLCDGPVIDRGVIDCNKIQNALLEKGSLSITPVRGIFKRSDLLCWLSEAGKLLGNDFMFRPGFLVGNDLWIWLSASSKYSVCYSHYSPIASLGCDDDSTTVSDNKNNKLSNLVKIYDAARSLFLHNQHIYPSVTTNSCLPLHILTIIYQGAPWIMGQLQVFNRLNLDWHWSIVEGPASPINCTGWCKGVPKHIVDDGTSDILRDLAHHKRISVTSKKEWNGKVQMVNEPLLARKSDEILIEIDCDEYWRPDQIETIYKMFSDDQTKSHAMFWCRFFVGPGLVMEDRNVYANNPKNEWRRAWRRQPGQVFLTHEPPTMTGSQDKFFTHSETESLGLVFDHYAYSLSSQVRFKESYYGYANALSKWRKLQECKNGTVLSSAFDWAVNSGVVRAL